MQAHNSCCATDGSDFPSNIYLLFQQLILLVPVHGNQAALGGTGDAVGAVPHGKFPSYAARHGTAAASPGYPDVRNAERTEAGAVNRVAGIQEPPGIPIVKGMQADGPAAEHGFPGKINQLLHAAPSLPFPSCSSVPFPASPAMLP